MKALVHILEGSDELKVGPLLLIIIPNCVRTPSKYSVHTNIRNSPKKNQ